MGESETIHFWDDFFWCDECQVYHETPCSTHAAYLVQDRTVLSRALLTLPQVLSHRVVTRVSKSPTPHQKATQHNGRPAHRRSYKSRERHLNSGDVDISGIGGSDAVFGVGGADGVDGTGSFGNVADVAGVDDVVDEGVGDGTMVGGLKGRGGQSDSGVSLGVNMEDNGQIGPRVGQDDSHTNSSISTIQNSAENDITACMNTSTDSSQNRIHDDASGNVSSIHLEHYDNVSDGGGTVFRDSVVEAGAESVSPGSAPESVGPESVGPESVGPVESDSVTLSRPISVSIETTIYTRRTVGKRNVFGPMEGEIKQAVADEGVREGEFKVFFRDGSSHHLCLTNENVCNWMMYVKPARTHQEHNLVAYQHRGQVYFKTTKLINPGTELRFWYSSDYAQRLGLPTARERLTSVEAQKKSKESAKRKRKNTSPLRRRNEELAAMTNQEQGDNADAESQDPTRFPGPGYSDSENWEGAGKMMKQDCTKDLEEDDCTMEDEHEIAQEEGRHTKNKRKGRHPTKIDQDDDDENEEASSRSTSRSPRSRSNSQEGEGEGRSCDEAGEPIPHTTVLFSGGELIGRENNGQEEGGDEGEAWEGVAREGLAQEGDGEGERERIVEIEIVGRRSKGQSSKGASGIRLACSRCRRRFRSTTVLVAHQLTCSKRAKESEHDESSPSKSSKQRQVLPCPQCSKIFYTKTNLTRHISTHGEILASRRYTCQVCDRTFARSDHLSVHMRRHDSERLTFRCGWCQKEYMTRTTFKAHVALHEAEAGEMKCGVCGKTGFESKEALVFHVKVHAGSRTVKGLLERRFPCDVCGRRFFSEKDVKRHSISHTKEREHGCPHCSRRFGRQDHMARHMKKCNGANGQPAANRIGGRRIRQVKLIVNSSSAIPSLTSAYFIDNSTDFNHPVAMGTSDAGVMAASGDPLLLAAGGAVGGPITLYSNNTAALLGSGMTDGSGLLGDGVAAGLGAGGLGGGSLSGLPVAPLPGQHQSQQFNVMAGGLGAGGGLDPKGGDYVSVPYISMGPGGGSGVGGHVGGTGRYVSVPINTLLNSLSGSAATSVGLSAATNDITKGTVGIDQPLDLHQSSVAMGPMLGGSSFSSSGTLSHIGGMITSSSGGMWSNSGLQQPQRFSAPVLINFQPSPPAARQPTDQSTSLVMESLNLTTLQPAMTSLHSPTPIHQLPPHLHPSAISPQHPIVSSIPTLTDPAFRGLMSQSGSSIAPFIDRPTIVTAADAYGSRGLIGELSPSLDDVSTSSLRRGISSLGRVSSLGGGVPSLGAGISSLEGGITSGVDGQVNDRMSLHVSNADGTQGGRDDDDNDDDDDDGSSVLGSHDHEGSNEDASMSEGLFGGRV